MVDLEEIIEIANKFSSENEVLEIAPLGSGHIHQTYLVTTSSMEIPNFVLQKVNTSVFSNPDNLENNHRKLTEFLRGNSNITFVEPLLSLNDNYYVVVNKEYWRAFEYITNSKTIDFVTEPDQAYQAAWAFGEFTKSLQHFPANELIEVLPGFHNLNYRYEDFQNSIINSKDLASSVNNEIETTERYYKILQVDKLEVKTMALRVIHNDTKISNILFDNITLKAKAVIDLDTVGMGFIINDFGDMVRSFTNAATEDEKDLNLVDVRINIFEGLCEGYLSSLNKIITSDEIKYFLFGVKSIIYEQGMRFLTDYLSNNSYYKVDYSEQNLYRARNQFKLLQSVLWKEHELQAILKRYLN